jgi:hypothetical protein
MPAQLPHIRTNETEKGERKCWQTSRKIMIRRVPAMSEMHLLDALAARRGCYISDLEVYSLLRMAAIWDLCRMEEDKFPLCQWQDAVHYLTGVEKEFASIVEIKEFLQNEIR